MIAGFLFIAGTIFGSFISAYTYRWPRGLSVSKGRSKCPECKAIINWYDNIPIVSYLLLRGRCRNCRERISIRYPLIELSTGILFSITYNFFANCVTALPGSEPQTGPVCVWTKVLGLWALPYLLVVAGILVAIYVIDFENQLIPDSLVYFLFTTSTFLILLFFRDEFYARLFVAFSAAVFFLILHLVTKGKGMGLGDVKLVLALSPFLGFSLTLVWLFASFVSGALVGLVLMAFKKASFGKHIAFGPFLVVSFFVTLFYGQSLANVLIPF